MDNEKRLKVIKKVDSSAILEKEEILFEIDKIKIKYNVKKREFYVNEDFFGKIPHIMSDGKICLYGNLEVYLNEVVEENSLYSIVSIYIPWLFRLPLKLKLLEFLFEIEFYIAQFLGYKVEEKNLKTNGVYKSIRIDTLEQLWVTIEEMEKFSTYQIYVSGYEDYAIYLQKVNDRILFERDLYKKARQRVTGRKCDNLIGKTIFIGVGSVNSYIIKYALANGLKDIVLVDHDKYTKDNAFRFAFPYKGKKKIYAVKEFCKNLDKISLKFYNTNVKADSDKIMLENCERVVVSVDNFMSWIQIASFLEKNCPENVEIIFAAINNFGENAKFVRTTSKKIMNITYDFLFKSKIKQRRELIGNGCGKSIAVYDEEILVRLAKKVVKAILEKNNEDEIIYVEIQED